MSATMSDFEEPKEEVGTEQAPSVTDSAPANPRKRKKSSRACDFCHVNHQPCDNAKPRCSYCERHNKNCLYLRPQKKRGPAQGYRSALHTLRESAAAWGAALNLIPSLGPVVEGYLKQPEGKRLIKAIKDPTQQEFFIQAWQQSTVFKTFFGDESSEADKSNSAENGDSAADVQQTQQLDSAILPQAQPTPTDNLFPRFDTTMTSVPTPSPSHASHDGSKVRQPSFNTRFRPRQQSISLSDIVAKDAARPSQGFSQTLVPLGFAPNESMEDFLAMSFDPEPLEQPAETDPTLGSEMDQKAYYELLMGKKFS